MNLSPASAGLETDVLVVVELGAPLAAVAAPDHPLNQAIQEAVAQRVDVLLGVLGVPGRTSVSVTAGEVPMPPRRWFRLSLNGRACHCPDELLFRLAEYVRGRRSKDRETLESLLEWCVGLAARADSTGDGGELVEFLACACGEAAGRSPSLLLGSAQAEAYLRDLPTTEAGPPDGWMQDEETAIAVLRALLDLRLSISNAEAVVRVFADAYDRPSEEALEDLVMALRANVVELLMPSDYLEQLTSATPEMDAGVFEFVRDGLFVELGSRYPPFRFVADESLRPGTFAFTINSLLTPPLLGLQANECLVNETPERLEGYDVRGVTRNPATGQPGTVIPLASKARAEGEDDLTVWDQSGFFVLALAAALRENAGCFFDRAVAEREIHGIRLAFPALGDAIQSRVPLWALTTTLRELVREQVSIRNLRLILEELLEYEEGEMVGPNPLTFEDEDGGLALLGRTERIRLRLAPQIQERAARRTGTVVAYLLDPKIERGLIGWAAAMGVNGTGHEQAEALLTGVRAEIDQLEEEAPNAALPIILTSAAVRRAASNIVQQEFPRVTVFAHEELVDVNVQPVARIGAEATHLGA